MRTSIAILFLLMGATAQAAMVEVPLADTTAKAEVIVKGEVITQKSDWDPYYRTILTDVVVRVDESLKGFMSKGETITVRVEGGEVGETGIWVEHQPRFHDAEKVLLFLRYDESDVLTVQNLELGKYTLFGEQAYDYRGRVQSLPELKTSIRAMTETER